MKVCMVGEAAGRGSASRRRAPRPCRPSSSRVRGPQGPLAFRFGWRPAALNVPTKLSAARPGVGGVRGSILLQFARIADPVDGTTECAQAIYDVFFVEADFPRRFPPRPAKVSGSFSRSQSFKMITPSPERARSFADICDGIVEQPLECLPPVGGERGHGPAG